MANFNSDRWSSYSNKETEIARKLGARTTTHNKGPISRKYLIDGEYASEHEG